MAASSERSRSSTSAGARYGSSASASSTVYRLSLTKKSAPEQRGETLARRTAHVLRCLDDRVAVVVDVAVADRPVTTVVIEQHVRGRRSVRGEPDRSRIRDDRSVRKPLDERNVDVAVDDQ